MTVIFKKTERLLPNAIRASLAASLFSVSAANAIEHVPSNDIIVTANRTAITADQALASVTVITRDDIQRLQIRSTVDLLRSQANINIKNSGGATQQSSISMRGTNSNHTLFLIDGVKVGSATTGLTAFQNIPVDQIERIEIVKGPRSSLYGSEAIGGVIQIFTRSGQEGAFNPTLAVGGGSNDAYHTSVGVNGRVKRASYSANLSYKESDGHDAYKLFETDEDGFDELSYSLSGGFDITSKTSLSFQYLRSEAETDYDDSFGFYSKPYTETLLQVISAGVESQLMDEWLSAFNIGKSWDKSDNFGSNTKLSTYETERDTASWLNHVDVYQNVLLSLGIDYQKDEIKSTDNFLVSKRDNYGVFTQVQASVEAHDIEASLRLDDNEQFGKETTGAVAWGYSFANGTRLKASYGTAFVAPDFNRLYFPPLMFPGFPPCCGGNPDLKPETSKSFEVGIESSIDQFNWSLVWFHTEIEDLIISPPPTYSPDNVDDAKIKGIELAMNTRFMDWDMSAELALIDPEDRGDQFDGKDLINRPTQTLSFNMDRDFGRYSAGMTFIAENESYGDQANTETNKLAGYGVLDLRAGYRVTDAFQLQAKVENVFDKDYETNKNFAQDDRSFYITLTYAP
jgi:vitamin B12 transporter